MRPPKSGNQPTEYQRLERCLQRAERKKSPGAQERSKQRCHKAHPGASALHSILSGKTSVTREPKPNKGTTSPIGQGLGGYGRIRGLGKIDTSSKTGMHGSLGRKRAEKIRKIGYSPAPKFVSVKIHFEYGSDRLSEASERRLQQLARKFTGRALIIEAHASSNGSSSANFKLSQRRGTAVKTALSENFQALGKAVPELFMVAHGESNAAATDHAKDRRVDIVSGFHPAASQVAMIHRALSTIRTKSYLLDASGSMAAVWQQVSQTDFPKGAKIYSFDGFRGVRKGIAQAPGSTTPLWASVTEIVQKSRNTTLTVITDGVATDKAEIDALITLSTKRKVNISVIYLGGKDSLGDIDALRKLAQLTGGQFYLRQ